MGETDTTKQGGSQPLPGQATPPAGAEKTSEGGAGTTSPDQPRTYTDEEVRNLVSDELAKAGRTSKALEKQAANLRAMEESINAEKAKIAKEVNTHQEAVSKFGPNFKKRTLNTIRKTAVTELEQIHKKILNEAMKVEIKLWMKSFVYPDDEAWIYTFQDRSGNIQFFVTHLSKGEVAKKRKTGKKFISVKDFKTLINTLKTLIKEGKHDEHIHLTGEQLIYNRMCEVSTPPK